MSLGEVPGWFTISATLLGTVLIARVADTPLTVDVAATTEVAEVKIAADNLGWRLQDARFKIGEASERSFRGTLMPAVGATVVWRRSGKGPLLLDVSPPEPGGVSASLDGDSGFQRVQGQLHITISDPATLDTAGHRPIFPFQGRVSLGEELRSDQRDQAYLLESGTLRLLGTTIWRKTLFQGGEYELVAGDILEATISPQQQSSSVHAEGRHKSENQHAGFITLGAERGLRAGFRVVGERTLVRRYRSSAPYVISMSWVERIYRDGDWQMIFVMVGAFSSVYVVWRKLRKSTVRSDSSSAGLLLVCVLVASPGTADVLSGTRSIAFSRFSMAFQQDSQKSGASSRTQVNEAPPASGQEALRVLRRIFAELGYQDVIGPEGLPVRFVTDIKDYRRDDCELVIRERMFFTPGGPSDQVLTETSFLSLAKLDADEIRAAKIPDDGRFPAGSWSIDVPAAGPAIRVEMVKSFREQEFERKELKPDVVHFYLRYEGKAREAAHAMQVLARACGAK